MRSIPYLLSAVTLALAAAPASAAVVVVASDVDLSAGPFTVTPTAGSSFIFAYAPLEQFDPNPVLVSTTGTAAVTTFFGAPSVFFTDPPVLFGPNTFPGFNPVSDPTRAPFSLTLSDLGLSYSLGGDTFFGYARFAGPDLISVAFETSANTPILGGAMAAAVPEPATWAMMLVGFGAVGYSLRSKRRSERLAAA